MSIFSSIMSKLFPASHPAATATATAGGPGATATAPGAASPATAPAPSAPPVDIEKVLGDLAAKNREKLNWRTSIVDLMKLLDLDSSLTARKSLAAELNYTGNTDDSAAMNIWLHKAVMQKVADNGGVVPASLKD